MSSRPGSRGTRRRPAQPHLRALPEVGDADRILVWGGGIWPWLDAITPIKAVERLETHRPAVHLHFPAVDRPQELSAVEMASAREAIAFAERRGLLGRRVHVGGAWVPYERRAEYLLEADLGISAHPDHLESRYAFRSRVLDYLWAGLPVVATRGDVLAELIERGGAGRAVAAGDDRAFADACAALLDDEAALDAARDAAARVAAAHRWDRVAGPTGGLLPRLRGAPAAEQATATDRPQRRRPLPGPAGDGARGTRRGRGGPQALAQRAHRRRPEAPTLSRYHQTVESTPSSSSIGVV